MSCEDRVIVVTGAASGIGRACCAIIKERGAKVIGMDINEPEAGEVDEYVAFDQGDPGYIDRSVSELPEGISGLMNVAGVAPSDRFSPTDVLRINFFGLRYFSEAIATKLGDSAAIVNMSSGAGSGWPTNVDAVKEFLAIQDFADIEVLVEKHEIGNVGIDNNAAYPLSKQLLNVWTMKTSGRLRGRDIRMNAVAPAAVETPIIDDFLKAFCEVSSRRMRSFGSATPDQVAKASVFLLSDDAEWISGAVLPVDGGAIAAGTIGKLGL